MALDYFVGLPCGIQEKLGMEEFMKTAKVGVLLGFLQERFKDLSEREFLAQKITMPYPIKTGWFGAKNEVIVKDLIKYWNSTAAKAEKPCSKCPVNIDEQVLGCYGCINYPVSPEGEKWLLDQFNPPDGEKAYVVHHVESFGVDGERLDRMRNAEPGRGIMSAPEPFRRTLECNGKEYTSSQLFEFILACAPVVEPLTQLGLSVDFGMVALPLEKAQQANMFAILEGMGQTPPEENWRRKLVSEYPIVNPPNSYEDKSVKQLKSFFVACWRAFGEEAAVVIDG